MIPGQPVPTELDLAAQRATERRVSKMAQAALPAEAPTEPAPAEAAAGPTPEAAPVDAAPAAVAAPEPGAVPSPPVAETVPPSVRDRETVGVVFIHGIGAQRAGETLLSWSAPIIRILSAWRDDRDLAHDPVVNSKVDLTGRTTPFIELEIRADPDDPVGRPAGRWVLTEAWWASDVEPPGISTMLKWLLWRGEGRRIGDGIVAGINAADDRRASIEARQAGDDAEDVAATPSTFTMLRRRLRDVLERFLILGLFVLLTVVAVPVYALIKLLGALPLPTVVQGISTAQLDWFLADWFGDVRVLLGDRAQAANIRSRVELAIEALAEYGCGTIVVLGHSGGTIVGYMTLADLPGDLRVDGFITHGQALGLAWRLGHYEGPLDAFRGVAGDEDELLRRGDRLVSGLPDELPWEDFWATHDPAPAGPLDDLDRAVTVPTRSHLVTNRNSIINDHGSYWDNEEGFVIPVMRLLDTVGRRHESDSRFFPGYGKRDPRVAARDARVVLLSRFWLLWLTLAIGTAVVGILAGPAGFPAFGAFVLGLPGSLLTPPPPGDGAWVWIVGALAIYLLSYGVQRISIARWDEWDAESRARARHRDFFAPKAGSLIPQWTLLLIAQVVVVVLALGGGPRPFLLAVYAALLLVGWLPREWRRRVVPPPAPPAEL
jgi:hypothetical protein